MKSWGVLYWRVPSGGGSSKGTLGEKEEENVAVASKGPNQWQGEKKKKKDLSKVKWFRCGELGHYSTQCPLKKEDKKEKHDQAAGSTKINKLFSRLEEDICNYTSKREVGRFRAIFPKLCRRWVVSIDLSSWIIIWLRGPTIFSSKMD